MSGREKRIATLNAVQEQRKQNCLVRTEKAIAQIQKKGQRLSFANIARAADVSVSYLYKYPEIKQRIQDLRIEQERNGKPATPQTRSDKSSQVIINQLKERIKKLQTERDSLRRINQGLAGRVYHLQNVEDLVERLRAENTLLKEQMNESRER